MPSVGNGGLNPNKTMRRVLLIFALLSNLASYGQSEVWLIGTAHKETNYINPDTLLNIFDKIKPDVVLLELEEKHFTKGFNFDVSKYPLKDYLVNNENIAGYKYQKQRGIQLRPFDINGRHEFYEKENYYKRENEMFGDMLKLYKNNTVFESCKVDFEILLSALNSYESLKFSSLREANSEITMKFLALKTKIDFELILSITRQNKELSKWVEFAELRKNYWDKRNNGMVENIIKYANEFKGKKVVVLVGNDHKYALNEKLKQKNVDVREYYK